MSFVNNAVRSRPAFVYSEYKNILFARNIDGSCRKDNSRFNSVSDNVFIFSDFLINISISTPSILLGLPFSSKCQKSNPPEALAKMNIGQKLFSVCVGISRQ